MALCFSELKKTTTTIQIALPSILGLGYGSLCEWGMPEEHEKYPFALCGM